MKPAFLSFCLILALFIAALAGCDPAAPGSSPVPTGAPITEIQQPANLSGQATPPPALGLQETTPPARIEQPDGSAPANVRPKEDIPAVILRSGPGAFYEQVGELHAGEARTVTGKNSQSDWWQVDFQGEPAWVFSALVDFDGDPASVPFASGFSPPLASPPNVDSAQGIANIRLITGQPDLQLTFQGVVPEPNANLRQALSFTGEQGSQFYVDLLSAQVIEFTLTSSSVVGPSQALSLEALRLIAVNIARQHSTYFLLNQAGLSYSEGEKGERTFFRWEDRTGGSLPMPPLMQFGLGPDGKILSYLNTLDLH